MELVDQAPRLTVHGESQTTISGPTLSLWRAPTENDLIRHMSGQEHKPASRWMAMGLNQLVSTWEPLESGNAGAAFEGVYKAGEEEVARCRLWLTPGIEGGEQKLTAEVDLSDRLTDVPRVGLRFELPEGYEHLSWYGRGPQESYPDRANGYPLGVWKSSVEQQYIPYIVPQEHGGHSDTRWVRLAGGEGMPPVSVVAPVSAPFHFSALHTAPEDLDTLTHTWQIDPRRETVLIVDLFHRGIGTAACGPDTASRYTRGGGRVSGAIYLSG